MTAGDFADSPASLTAVIWKEYAVEEDSPVTVADVPFADWIFVPLRWIA